MKLIRDLGMRYPTETSKVKKRYGLYLCECGKETKARIDCITTSHTHTKSCGCSRRTLLSGVGINDANYQIFRTLNGKLITCPFYGRWTDMLKRAYSDKYHKKHPTYRDVTVCEEWHLFSNFKKWMETQDWESKELDKDILYPDNKIYSPATCCFVNRDLNAILVNQRSTRGEYPLGVSLPSHTRKFQAKIKIHHKTKHLGYYITKNEAHQVYLVAKIEYIKTFLVLVDKKIEMGLKKHIVILEKQLI